MAAEIGGWRFLIKMKMLTVGFIREDMKSEMGCPRD